MLKTKGNNFPKKYCHNVKTHLRDNISLKSEHTKF